MTAEVGILEHIHSLRGSLKPSLRTVADAVLARPAEARSMNIKELASSCGVSEASISRFVRGIGLPNYRAFQLRMVEEGASGTPARGQTPDDGLIYENIGRNDTAATILTKVAHRNADVSRACLSTLDPLVLERAARMVEQAKTLYFFAAGLSALAAENALLRFARIGKPAIFHRDRNNQILLAGSLQPGSLAIAVSDSGRTDQTVTALYAAKAAGVPTIAITAFAEAPLAKYADLTLITPAGYQPAGDEPLYYESMVSKFGQLLAIDVLYSLVAVHNYETSTAAVRRGNQFIQASRTARRQNDTD